MSTLDRRVQVLFDPDEYALLVARGRRENRSVGSIIRESVRQSSHQSSLRQEALASLLARADSLPDTPVGDWQQVKNSFERDSLAAIS